VRDVHGGGARALVQQLDLGAHLHAQLGVQVGQRLVEQEQLGVARQGTAHRDALALAAGQRAGLRSSRCSICSIRPRGHRGFALGLGHLAHLQAEGDVAGHGHVRVERVALEHHRDVAVLAGQVRHVALADVDAALGGVVQPGDHVEQGRLAAARGADKDEELAGTPEVDVVQHSTGLAEDLADVTDVQRTSTLDRARRQAAHEVLACQHVDQQRGQRGDDGRGHVDVVFLDRCWTVLARLFRPTVTGLLSAPENTTP
jgi:hypothetical protein